MARQKRNEKKSAKTFDTTEFDDVDETLEPRSGSVSPVQNPAGGDSVLLAKPTSGKKRPSESAYDSGDFSHEMQKMLESFGVDISKTMGQKKKRMEQHTQVTLKNANKKVDELWNNQQEARTKLQEEFSKQVSAVCTQWESDIEKAREQEEKLNNLFKQQMKMFQQSRIVQNQRLKTVKELSEQFVRGLEELDQTRRSQQASLQSELKKEMALLQKKIIMDTQQQDMANVRKSLHSMLF